MPFLADFWLWKQGGSIPASLGYALIAQTGTTASNEYSLVTAAVTSGPTLFVGDQGGAICGNSTEAYHYPNNSALSDSDHIVWSTHTSTSTTNFSIGNNIQCTAAGDQTTGLYVQYHSTNNSLDFAAVLTFFTNTLTPGPNTIPCQYGFQAVGSTTKGYFYNSSYTFSSGLVTANDGPPVPVSPSTFPYGSFWQTGGASNHTQALTQYMRTFSDVSFRSQLYTFPTATAATGPTFSAVFLNATVHSGHQAQSNGVSGTSGAVFFEMYTGGISSNQSSTEVYVWASATVVTSTAVTNVATVASPYHPVAGNSVPGYL